MPRYRLNKNPDANGLYEVHDETCKFYHVLTNFIDLGTHSNPILAVNFAKQYTPKADGCFWCCYPAHKG